MEKKKKKVTITIEDNALGQGISLYISGVENEAPGLHQTQAEFWGIKLFNLCLSALKAREPAKLTEENTKELS